MKGLHRMGVHLYSDAAVGTAKLQPELMKPCPVELEPADVGAVLTMDDLCDGLGRIPWTHPQCLALALPRPAFAKVGKRPCQEFLRQAVAHALLVTAADHARAQKQLVVLLDAAGADGFLITVRPELDVGLREQGHPMRIRDVAVGVHRTLAQDAQRLLVLESDGPWHTVVENGDVQLLVLLVVLVRMAVTMRVARTVLVAVLAMGFGGIHRFLVSCISA